MVCVQNLMRTRTIVGHQVSFPFFYGSVILLRGDLMARGDRHEARPLITVGPGTCSWRSSHLCKGELVGRKAWRNEKRGGVGQGKRGRCTLHEGEGWRGGKEWKRGKKERGSWNPKPSWACCNVTLARTTGFQNNQSEYRQLQPKHGFIDNMAKMMILCNNTWLQSQHNPNNYEAQTTTVGKTWSSWKNVVEMTNDNLLPQTQG